LPGQAPGHSIVSALLLVCATIQEILRLRPLCIPARDDVLFIPPRRAQCALAGRLL